MGEMRGCEQGKLLVLEWLFWWQHERRPDQIDEAFKACAGHVNGCPECMDAMNNAETDEHGE